MTAASLVDDVLTRALGMRKLEDGEATIMSSSSTSTSSSSNKDNKTQMILDELWLKIFSFLHVRDIVKSWMVIPILRQTIANEDKLWMELAKKEILAYGHGDFVQVLSRLGALTEKSGLVIMQLFHTPRKCFHSGCMKFFCERENHPSSCKYHPGKRKGRALSCCRQESFSAPGCKESTHCGRTFDAIKFVLPPIASPVDNNTSKSTFADSNIRLFA